MTSRKSRKKRSRKNIKEPWACPNNCPDWETIPCEHLVKELLKYDTSQSVNLVYIENTDKLPINQVGENPIEINMEDGFYDVAQMMDPFNLFAVRPDTYIEAEAKFRRKLRGAGLPSINRDILVYKFVYGMSLEDIKTELGMQSRQTVLNRLNASLDHLKKIGFKKDGDEGWG